MSTENLWGSLDSFKITKTPLSIVREQGTLLTEATKGILQGYVKIDSESGTISFSFSIIAMRLNQYKYELLRVQHGIKIYPVLVRSTTKEKAWKKCDNETSFLAAIKSILSSTETRKIIESLLSQSES